MYLIWLILYCNDLGGIAIFCGKLSLVLRPLPSHLHAVVQVGGGSPVVVRVT